MSSFYIIVIRIVIVTTPTTIESPKDFFLSDINKTIIDAISSMLEKLKFSLPLYYYSGKNSILYVVLLGVIISYRINAPKK